ncbi:MAG TPA: hypothetical protein P5191_16315 [Ruminococcus sp.]|nr:hypothetical protein [Ruminococcus sp.]
MNDIDLSGNVENTQNSVICTQTGDININTENVNLNGLVYAPNGCVNITAQNLNINSVIIIADTITITCPNLNANYNTQMAEFIGSVPEIDIDLEVIAFGDYNSDKDIFDIYWNTTVPKGSFDIQVSDDGENYSSIGTVTDENAFSYSFPEPFEKKYVKVIETTDYDETCESVPFLLLCDENGYAVKALDSDDDELPDIYELKLGTDPYAPDTDGDGLTDFQEYVYTQTDPLVYDSVTEGLSDSDADSDNDGLSNIDELTRGTYPWTSDSDDDGLSDYDEIYIYNTDPLNADSDGDGIDDGSEIKLGLDPNNSVTNGIPDAEYVIPQSIDADNSILSSINTEYSPYQLSVDIATNGDAEEELKINESSYSAAIENDAMIGASIDVDISDTCVPESIILKYDIKEEYTENTLGTFASLDELSGIKRLNVFRFDEEQGMLLPIETEFDVENNQLYAEVNEAGTYCLMDMEIWFDALGVEFPAESSAPNVPTPLAAPRASSGSSSEWEPDYVNAPVDLVFILQTAGNDENAFNMQKALIEAFCTYVYKNNIDVDTYIHNHV